MTKTGTAEVPAREPPNNPLRLQGICPGVGVGYSCKPATSRTASALPGQDTREP
jgi:hypothetical protein